MPKVSIIVPIYNVEKYIEKCARSLFSQTLGDIEYIFIDDCSPDRSVEILQRVIREYQTRIQEKHWIIKIERMVKNSGQSAVRRHGIQLATGDYVIHCDSDDWIEENMVAEMWNLAIKNNLDVVVCDFTHVKGGETVYYKGMKAHDAEGFFHEVLSDQSSWAVWNKLFKRSLYSHVVFPENGMNVGEDMVMVIQLLYYCKNVGYIKKPFYNYRENATSITNRKTTLGIINNFTQLYSNISTLYGVFKNTCSDKTVRNELIRMMRIATNNVFKDLDESKRMILFNRLCRLTIKICLSSYVSMLGKVQYFKCLGMMFRSMVGYRISKVHLAK